MSAIHGATETKKAELIVLENGFYKVIATRKIKKEFKDTYFNKEKIAELNKTETRGEWVLA